MSAPAQIERGTPRRATDPEFFEQTVPRALVHRSAVSEVLLTGAAPRGRDVHTVGTQWARGHSYYGAIDGRWHDPMLFAESIRQAGLFLAHHALGVPMDHRFLVGSASFEISEEGVRLVDRPADVLLDVTLRDIRCRGVHVSSFAYDVTAHRAGVRIGSGHTTVDCVAPHVYRRLRGDHADARPPLTLPQAAPPALVGRSRESDVVLGTSSVEGTHVLRADATHPVLFDHPVDHVPGMALMEAARQAALIALRLPNGLLVACSATFHRYVEFDTPCLVSVTEPTEGAAGAWTLTASFHQNGSVAGSCRVTVLDGR
ncbi:A-factor biosynthesis protein [Streptomyces sp. TRM43335]|uniref:A-factor biosynthesis protein n=1 Tax=Streptomyces taklimakanensis TaxID=2569853 RepID=A0A6G2BG29_9ACTN|nr:ScbA/BarX family gamma-butyrolactone biosynthesis protein [Streptomyces taklimakanensis]MTE21013.1 A-factor biosynthesis protein [Streptomyces taklimakanensis]